ncbi:hypothetical protein M404DRAFT_174118 [Pisolithus tinctorius Marx 270]|uniref:Uncharacterized protein n=1 Tax=Pisolithus tinctorius Marx 270 TaxID=870435 RepID=A0A0C3PY44_PISTI|nr:hypothetical protein M404DRAFT_174118 [Pisolithus tinctorius Marx 270]
MTNPFQTYSAAQKDFWVGLVYLFIARVVTYNVDSLCSAGHGDQATIVDSSANTKLPYSMPMAFSESHWSRIHSDKSVFIYFSIYIMDDTKYPAVLYFCLAAELKTTCCTSALPLPSVSTLGVMGRVAVPTARLPRPQLAVSPARFRWTGERISTWLAFGASIRPVSLFNAQAY